MKILVRFTDTLKEVLLLYLLLVVTCAGFIAAAEGLQFFDALWLAFVTSTSTGYGDLSAKTALGRFVSVALMHVSLFLIAPLIVGHIIGQVLHNKNEFTNEEQEDIKRKVDAIYKHITKE